MKHLQYIFISLMGLTVFMSNLDNSEAGGKSRKHAADAGFADKEKQSAENNEANTAKDSMIGTYRCWMFNVSGAGKRCTSPALILKEDGRYSMGSEKGTWKYEGGDLILSESKLRGPGQVQGGSSGIQVIFKYTYRNWPHVVTYLKQDFKSTAAQDTRMPGSVVITPASKEGPPVNIDVTIIFPESGNVGWINGAAIMEKGETTGPETLANNDGENTVSTYFRSMPSGKVYDIYVTTGFEKKYVGTVDLRKVTEDVKVKLYAK